MTSRDSNGARRVWYWPPWQLTNPLWPPLWHGGDEFGRRTLVIQPPLLGAVIIALEGRHTFALFSDTGNLIDDFDTFNEASCALDGIGWNENVGLLEFDAQGMCVYRHWPDSAARGQNER